MFCASVTPLNSSHLADSARSLRGTSLNVLARKGFAVGGVREQLVLGLIITLCVSLVRIPMFATFHRIGVRFLARGFDRLIAIGQSPIKQSSSINDNISTVVVSEFGCRSPNFRKAAQALREFNDAMPAARDGFRIIDQDAQPRMARTEQKVS